MDHDLALVIGLVVSVFSVPAMVSAFSEGRVPRVAAIAILIGGGLAAWAITGKPGGYTMEQIPEVFVQVVRDLLK
ncbi:MAG: hypothetical protein AAF891_01890 [Pseudomonadota bacterium]